MIVELGKGVYVHEVAIRDGWLLACARSLPGLVGHPEWLSEVRANALARG